MVPITSPTNACSQVWEEISLGAMLVAKMLSIFVFCGTIANAQCERTVIGSNAKVCIDLYVHIWNYLIVPPLSVSRIPLNVVILIMFRARGPVANCFRDRETT